jgi:FMN phosphatase YigB (HAD superfamily)
LFRRRKGLAAEGLALPVLLHAIILRWKAGGSDMQKKCVLIVDLDNTLFDWVDIWYRSFKPMLDSLISTSGVSQEVLEGEIKEVFERHGTTEYAFLIEEMPSLRIAHPTADLTEVYADAIEAYRKGRASALRLYPGVKETLRKLKSRGCTIVGYTESLAFYSAYRVRKLGLDPLIDYLYSPADHDLPANLTAEQIRLYHPKYYEFRHTIHRHTPKGHLKPAPEILKKIVHDLRVPVASAVYLGDNLMKDVAMAQEAGITDVWAKYGVANNREEYDLLRRVTHWSDAAVERERNLTAEEVAPTYVLEGSIDELFDQFAFARSDEVLADTVPIALEAWKKTIDVQQHFNDIELRIRNFAITLLVAVLGATAFAMKEHVWVDLPVWMVSVGLLVSVVAVFLLIAMFSSRKGLRQVAGVLAVDWILFYAIASWYTGEIPGNTSLSLASIILSAGIIATLGFWFMDAAWYHRLLYGAVAHALAIEKQYPTLPELQLSEAIKKESALTMHLPWGSKRISSKHKIHFFYVTIILFQAVAILVAQLSG